jgi:hypothetical protein
MAEEPDVIRQQIDVTRSSLTEKLESLENEVRGTVEGAKARVENTIESVKSTVKNVKRQFDLRYQVDRHPWAMMGASVVAGYLAETVLSPHLKGRRFSTAPMPSEVAAMGAMAPEAFEGDGHRAVRAAPIPPERPAGSGLVNWFLNQFHDEIQEAKGVAIGATMGLVRDVVKQSLPQLAPHVDEIMNSMTSKLGGRPIHQPILETAPHGSASMRGRAEF